ncbi:MAG: alpha/beta hydrolase [Candidatus Eremiobacteraeota bacterium]|nr:alpha/beta hydrolase [Candidatus Eremiobacteraeota bacterium]
MKPFAHTGGERFECAGAGLYFEQYGRGEPWLLLHGGFGSLEDFQPLLPLLEGYRCVGLDSRGHGASTLGDGELTYERMERDVEALVERLDLKDLSVLGFSDGGIVALRLARRLALRRLVVVGAQHRLTEDEKKLKLLAGVTGESWRKKFPETYELYQRVNPTPDFDRLARRAVGMWLDAGPSGHPGDVAGVGCPTLLVRGDEDHLVDLPVMVELRESIRGSCLFNVPLAGHVAYLDQPELFAAGFRAFLDS